MQKKRPNSGEETWRPVYRFVFPEKSANHKGAFRRNPVGETGMYAAEQVEL